MKIKDNKTVRILYNPLVLVIFLILILVSACSSPKPKEPVKKELPQSFVVHPEWSRNANIYEVNVRQFSPGGTLDAFTSHIPRLKEMGVDIIWLMPVNPIGEKNRKGSLGSYYSVQDYKAVNPAFGSHEDLKELVSKAHELGMKVILDWVASHTAWDHGWITEHPGWYKKDSLGNIISPFDWSDVAQLDYNNKEVWSAMVDAMQYWIRDADIDGYRCDVAWMMPIEFWDYTRRELDKIKPVFMLAEAEGPQYHTRAFDMTYSWELHHLMNFIAQGKKNARALDSLLMKQDTLYPADAYRMLFTSNHDENSWKGSEFERMGDAAAVMAVLTATLPGMPLIYNGQEAAFNKRLRFFEKDTVVWNDYPLQNFYKKLFTLKHSNRSLWNGNAGGMMKRISTDSDSTVFAFIRGKEGQRVFVITNLCDKEQQVRLPGKDFAGNYIELFNDVGETFKKGDTIRLKPWDYKVYVMK